MNRPEPAYRKIMDEIAARILSGELAPGDQVPSIRDLSEEYDVAQGTANRAIDELAKAGLVTINRGDIGTRVREYTPIRRSSPSRLSRDWWGEGLQIQDADTAGRLRVVDVEVGEQPAPSWVAGPMRIEAGTPVVYRSRRFAVDDRSVQLATSFLPTELAIAAPRILHTDTGPGGVYARLAEIDQAPAEFIEILWARMPRPDETRRLALPRGTPVVEITRHALTKERRCVEVNRMVLDASAYRLEYQFSA